MKQALLEIVCPVEFGEELVFDGAGGKSEGWDSVGGKGWATEPCSFGSIDAEGRNSSVGMSVVFCATDEVLTKGLESRWGRGGRSIWPEAAVFGDDRREMVILEDNLVGVEFVCEADGFAVERQIDSKAC